MKLYNYNSYEEYVAAQKEAWEYAFELGRGKNHSVNEVAAMFGITPKYEDDKPSEAQITLNDDIVAKEILDWEAVIELQTYVRSLNL